MQHEGKDNSKINTQQNLSPGRSTGLHMSGMAGRGPGGFGGQRGMMPVVKPKNFKKTFARMWRYFGKERTLLSVIFAFVVFSAAVGLLVPYILGRSIDAMHAKNNLVDFELLGFLVGALIFVYLTDAFIVFLQGWLMAGVSQRIVKALRQTLFTKLQKLPIVYFDLHTHGEIMSRLTNDIENVSTTISNATTHLMSAVITILGSFIMMLVLSPVLTLASLITVPLVFLLTRTIAKRTKVFFKEQQIELGRLNGHIEETISGIHVVKAFNHEEKTIRQFDEINLKLSDIGLKAQIWSGYIMPLMNVINNIGFAAIAGVGGVMAVKGLITVGVIASFLSYSRQFSRPLNELANIFNNLQSAVAGAERVFEVLDQQDEPSDPEGAEVLNDPQGNVVFENVSFGYRSDVPVLKDISFQAEAGSTVALVGPTGAGKTTIVNLLARFYDVSAGRILIDGRDIREYTRDSLRKCFGIVLQDTYLFSGTISENIKYGRPDASNEEVKMAAEMANADAFINRLPKGYETILSESGGNLSQGQRQLLAIARAILSNPSILILDEATSNIDTRTELHIQEAMLKLMDGRTSFIIAHRLSTIRDADIIMVIDGGMIVEKGNHASLLEKGGIYHKMYYGQLKQTEDV